MSDNERLSRELRNRADQLGGHPISFDDVKRSATKMKWQQRAAAGAVAAAVLAIAVPVGIAVTGNNGNSNGGDRVANPPTPTVSETPTPTINPDGTVTLTLDAPEGAAPRVAWLEGTTLHTADGETFTLPKAYDDVTPFNGGFMGFSYVDSTIDVIQNGDVVDSFPGSGFAFPSVNAFGTEVAWYEGDVDGGQLKRGFVDGSAEAEESINVPAGYLVTPLYLTPSVRLVYSLENQSEPYDKTIWWTDFVNDEDVHQIEGGTSVGGYNTETGQLAVMTDVSDFGSCWKLFSYGGGEAPETFGKETCDYSLGEFSADGNYVIGWDAYRDGWGNGDIAILDATTLKPIIEFKPEKDYGLQDAVWESDSYLVATVYLDGKWQLVRLGVDGAIMTVSAPVTADDLSNPFRFVSAN